MALSLLAALKVGPACARDAAPRLTVGTPLRGLPLGRKLELLEDPSGKLGIVDVVSGAYADRFVESQVDAPSLGFTSSAYWLRLRVVNATAAAEPWLLELSYPLLDDVTLFVPHGPEGFDARRTGDLRAFGERDIAARNFVFSLEEPALGARTYYLRVATSGTMNLPLVAWSTRAFLEHQHLDWAMLCIFYGALLVMACYSACVALFARQREYLPYLGYILCVAVCQFTLAGHTFQFLLPGAPWLVHRLLPASVAATLAFGTAIVRTYLPGRHLLNRLASFVIAYCVALCVGSFVLPYQALIRITNLSVVVLMSLAILYGIELTRVAGRRARLFVLGWGSAIIGALIAALQNAGWLGQGFLTDWSLQLGCTVQLVLLSSALADKLNEARAELSLVNATLSQKLSDLSTVLTRTEQATLRAERATELKDEFLATMSHEFRTPLNPIINIPEEMRHEFLAIDGASCTRCQSRFELDEQERIEDVAACPECDSRGSLVRDTVLRYVGDPTRTRRYLTKIERSGQQLLHVVNGILDFSKLQAGHLELTEEAFEVAPLLLEVGGLVRMQARQKDLGITCMVKSQNSVLTGDAARIRQILLILLDNAIKYSAEGSYITLRAEQLCGEYTFSVSDQGIGIEARHFESIFASFEQVYKGNTRRYGGTGLGLSIARSLAHMHGGDLTVQSELGKGSTFTLTIPLRALATQSAPLRAAGGTR